MTTDAKRMDLPFVEVRRRWSDPWRVVPHLEVDRFDCTVAPALPSAHLSWHYGEIQSPGVVAFTTEFPILAKLQDWYVRISRPGTIAETPEGEVYQQSFPVWYGVITGGVEVYDGHDIVDAAGLSSASGDESPNARGLEALLYRAGIDGSYILSAAEGVKVDARLPWNLWDARTSTLQGNRSTAKITSPSGVSAHVFSDTDKATWTVADIVEYLIAWFAPEGLVMGVSGTTANLAKVSIAVSPFRTVAEGLRQLVARERGHAWRVTVSESGGTTTTSVQIVSGFESDVSVGGVVMEGSEAVVDLKGDADEVTVVEVRRSSESQFDRVVVRGSPIILMGTFAVGTHLEAAWSAAQEAAYEATDDLGRTADKYRHVYTTFRIDPDELLGGPGCTDDGHLITHLGDAPIWTVGKRFLRRLPLPVTGSDASGPVEFRPPLAVVAHQDDESGTAYCPIDRLSEAIDGAPNMGLSILDGEMGVRILTRPNHRFALDRFAGDSAVDAVVDYQSLQVTLAWASTEHLRVVAEIANDRQADAQRTLTIESPHLQMWVQMNETVTDVVDGELIKSDGLVELRNDREVAAAIAAMAKAWYSRSRTAATVTFSTLVYSALIGPGYLLRRITRAQGAVEVHTLITRIVYDCRNGTTILQTDFAELDFAAMANGGRGGGRTALAVPGLSADPGFAGADDATDNLPVRLPGSEAATNAPFGVLLTQDGGDTGADDEECTYTYEVRALDDYTVLDTDVTPETPRLHFCAYWYAGETRTAPAVATSRYGLACLDSTGTLRLLVAYGEIAKDAGLLIRFGKATGNWGGTNSVTLDPCDKDGVDIAAASNVTGYIFSPTGTTPEFARISTDDVLPYVSFGDGTVGMILNVNPLPAAVAADENKVLAIDSDGRVKVDWLRFTT